MLTPHEIEIKRFERAFKGYKPSEVDEFLNILSEDYETLYKENATLKSKLAVLVEKIEEYKSMEESLRNALVSAQKMGESMLKEANIRSEYIISEASAKAERAMSLVSDQIIKEKRALDEAKRETQLFKTRVIGLLNSQIELLKGIPAYDGEENEPESKKAESTPAAPEFKAAAKEPETDFDISQKETAPWEEPAEKGQFERDGREDSDIPGLDYSFDLPMEERDKAADFSGLRPLSSDEF
jgi:cell division initiation protein